MWLWVKMASYINIISQILKKNVHNIIANPTLICLLLDLILRISAKTLQQKHFPLVAKTQLNANIQIFQFVFFFVLFQESNCLIMACLGAPAMYWVFLINHLFLSFNMSQAMNTAMFFEPFTLQGAAYFVSSSVFIIVPLYLLIYLNNFVLIQ